jgi:hypothetical protein
MGQKNRGDGMPFGIVTFKVVKPIFLPLIFLP